MTYQEFKNKHTGKFLDFDKHYGAQCWDLGEYYFTECLGLSSTILSGSGNVKNMLKEPKKSLMLKYFDEVSTGAMIQGDVVIWEYGHIAIFDNWNGSYNSYLSQNPNAVKVIKLTRSGAHAFRLKGTTPIVKPTTTHSVLKIGSKGSEVKLLQSLLGLTQDGSFGPKTLIAVKNFQRTHGLVVDGSVGPKTWKALGV